MPTKKNLQLAYAAVVDCPVGAVDVLNYQGIAPVFAVTLVDAAERYQMLMDYVTGQMVPGIDYGIMPGVTKPTLLKPGAEKLCDVFGFSKRFEISNRLEDWEEGIFAYEVKAILINKANQLVEAEGLGSCNCRERKYLKQNAYNIANTLLKMAKKRALVDAVLTATRSSGIFTQDMEDMAALGGGTSVQHKAVCPSKGSLPAKLAEVFSLANAKNLPSHEAKKLLAERYGVQSSTCMDAAMVEDFIAFLHAM
jgi:hypothetical protein